MQPDEVLGNMIMFIVAGTITTSGTLTALLHCLAIHPEKQERLRQEVMASDEQIWFARNSYLAAFVQEVLRMFPHLPRVDRVATSDFKLDVGDGRTISISSGSKVRLPVFALNRNSVLFPDPDTFEPERFLPGGVSENSPIYTFAIGPRYCVGESFARMVIASLVAQVLLRFRIERSPRTPDQLDFSASGLVLESKESVVRIVKLD